MPVKCVSPSGQQALVQAFVDGNSVSEIVEHFGLKNTTVRRVLVEHGKLPSVNYHKTAEEIEMLRVLRLANINTAHDLRAKLANSTPIVAPVALQPMPSSHPHPLRLPAFAELKVGDQVMTAAQGWSYVYDLKMDGLKPLMQLDKSNAWFLFYTPDSVPVGYQPNFAVIDWRSKS